VNFGIAPNVFAFARPKRGERALRQYGLADVDNPLDALATTGVANLTQASGKFNKSRRHGPGYTASWSSRGAAD